MAATPEPERADPVAMLERLRDRQLLDPNTLACSRSYQPLQQALVDRDAEATIRLALGGAAACTAAGAEATCAASRGDRCPLGHARRLREAALAHMKRPTDVGAVPEKQAKRVRRHLQWGADRHPLKALPSLQVARAFLAGKPCTLTPAAVRVEVPGGTASLGEPVEITGGQQRLVLHSPTGLGKTVAAAWMISRLGGIYLTAYDLLRVGFDQDVPTRGDLKQAPLVVVDQLGRESRGATDHGPGMAEWLIDLRYGVDRPLVLIGNFGSLQQLVEHYGSEGAGQILGSRLSEETAWARLTGPDLRLCGDL